MLWYCSVESVETGYYIPFPIPSCCVIALYSRWNDISLCNYILRWWDGKNLSWLSWRAGSWVPVHYVAYYPNNIRYIIMQWYMFHFGTIHHACRGTTRSWKIWNAELCSDSEVPFLHCWNLLNWTWRFWATINHGCFLLHIAALFNSNPMARLRGFQRGEPPFREMIIYGQPLLGNTSGLATHARALEQAVHLCRTSARLKCVQLPGRS